MARWVPLDSTQIAAINVTIDLLGGDQYAAFLLFKGQTGFAASTARKKWNEAFKAQPSKKLKQLAKVERIAKQLPKKGFLATKQKLRTALRPPIKKEVEAAIRPPKRPKKPKIKEEIVWYGQVALFEDTPEVSDLYVYLPGGLTETAVQAWVASHAGGQGIGWGLERFINYEKRDASMESFDYGLHLTSLTGKSYFYKYQSAWGDHY